MVCHAQDFRSAVGLALLYAVPVALLEPLSFAIVKLTGLIIDACCPLPFWSHDRVFNRLNPSWLGLSVVPLSLRVANSYS